MIVFLLVASAVLCEASFNFLAVDNTTIQALGLSSGCITALNATVNCDATTAGLAAMGPDFNYWTSDNITTLCTSGCASSLSSWVSGVESSCTIGTDVVYVNGAATQVELFPLVYQYNYQLTCLKDSSGNDCFYESQSWQGSDYQKYSVFACSDPDVAPSIPVCSGGEGAATLAPDMMAVTNLYNSSLYCSDCFLRLWQQRLMSPLLVADDWTDYLVSQFDLLQTGCSTTMPLTTSALSNLFTPAATTSATSTTVSSTMPTATGGANSTNATCPGQLVAPTQLNCLQMSDAYNVSTGTVMQITADPFCSFNTSICLPLPCPLDTVTASGVTCQSLATEYSTTDQPVSLPLFLSWNLNILGDCGSLYVYQRVCKGPPGGKATPTGTFYVPTAMNSIYTTATADEPTQTGTTSSCGLYYDVVVGDTCNSVALRFGTTFAELQALNTYLNDDCTNLWIGYAVCVAPVTAPPVSTDGSCGPANGYTTCVGSTFGSCCSTSGYCGSTDPYCAPGNCVSGDCIVETVTTDGSCGPDNNYMICTNPDYGDCCSIYGWCGSTDSYCGTGNCYSGACTTDEGGPSTDGSCGPLFAGNKTCVGTQFGNCCSNYGYCGSTSDYCGAGNCYSGCS